EKNLQLRKMMELTSNEAVKQAVLAGLGASIMPLIGIRNEIKQEQLQIVPVKGLPIESTWQVVWLENKQHSPQADAFLNYLRENKARIIREKFSWLEAMR
ncbi:MAG: LysR family transcriptional regulator, partial [Saprospiraceae bacterium]|nr:LysR family transcriptional regulator [Saprospiraceae bacterium]